MIAAHQEDIIGVQQLLANQDEVELTPMNAGRKKTSLNFSLFVARKYWRKRWATLYRFRAHGVENGAFSSGASRSLWINCNHLQTAIN
jgi:hypothetical protein